MTTLSKPDRGTLFDLPFETARARISSLQASAAPVIPTRAGAPTAGRVPLRRLRSALGTRLVDVGRALLAEDGTGQVITRT